MKEREKAGHSGSATAPLVRRIGAMQTKTSRLAEDAPSRYDHVARTVAVKRTSLSSPPTVDSLAGDFKKLMDELRPETRKALGQAFGPIAAGQQSQVPENTPAAKGQLDALDRYYSDEILEKLNGIVSRASALDRIGLEIAPNRGVQFLFEEAHRC